MKKKALRKDFYMEIKKSLGRFLSIFFIVALGVAFFSGIRSSEPDMRQTGDAYFDAENLMDLRVMGTMGLTDSDIDALKTVKGVNGVEGAYSIDAVGMDKIERQRVLHVMSLPQSMNQLTVTKGRLPRTEKECLLDEDYANDLSYQLGDIISLESGTKTELGETLKETKLRIVGIGNSPCYISFGRGSSNVGTGKINGFAVVIQEAFQMDVYTEAYIEVKGAKEKTAFTNGYETTVETVRKRIKAIEKKRCRVRYDEIISEAEEKIADATRELDDSKNEAATRLAEALQQLTDGEQQLNDAKEKINSGNAAIQDAKQELSKKQKELDDGNDAYKAGVKQLEDAKAELAEQETAYKQTYVSMMPQIEDGEAKAAQARTDLDHAWEGYYSLPDLTAPDAIAMKAGLEQKEQELQSSIIQLQDSRASLEAGATAIQDAHEEIAANEHALTQSKAELDRGTGQIKTAWKEIDEKEAKLQEAKEQIAVKEAELAQGRVEYETSKADAMEKLQGGQDEIAEAKEKIKDIKVPSWYVNDRSVLTEYSGYGENADRMRAIGQVFPVLFFLVAALISLTTMTRMVEEQRTQIGTLKALGYGKLAIASKYIGYALLATAGGSIFGVLIGEKILPYIIIYAYGIMYQHIPNILVPYNLEYALMATGAAVACTLGATIFACYKEMAAQPAVLMRPPAPKQGKRVLLERVTLLWKYLSFIWKSTIRNLIRYKKRFFMTVFGIGGCMGLMLVGFGLKDSILEIADLQYGEIQNYDGAVYLSDEITDENKEEVLQYTGSEPKIKNDIEVFMKSVTVMNGKQEKDIYLCVPDDSSAIEKFIVFRDRVSRKRYHLNDKGAILTEKMAKTLGVKRGEYIKLKGTNGEEKKVLIAEVCENYMGHYLYLTPALYKELYGKQPTYNSILFKMKNYNEDTVLQIGESILEYDGVMNVTYTSGIHEQLDNMLGSLDLVIGVLIISAGMLAFVVLYNLNNINITERQRELATIKVLGFYDGEVSAYVYRENILLTLIGALVGMGFGKVLHGFIITTVEIESAMFGRNINPQSYLYSFLFTVGFAFFVNWVMYFKLKRIDMVESLKSIE